MTKRSPVHPIRPSEVSETKGKDIPDVIFEAFNELIAQNHSGGISRVMQDEVMALVLRKFGERGEEVTRHQVFEKRWLDVEDSYRKAGWRVVYDKPGFNESYAPSFTFTAPHKR